MHAPFQHGAPRARHRVHVGRRLHTALELERGHARRHELDHIADRAVVVRAERTLSLGGLKAHALLAHEVERKAARLRAEPPVGRAALAQEARQHAEARVAGTDGPVRKDLEFTGGNAKPGSSRALLRRNGRNLRQRKLARERHPRRPQLAAKRHAARVVHVGLRRHVQLRVRPRTTHLGEKP